jgi:hypothetical protein
VQRRARHGQGELREGDEHPVDSSYREVLRAPGWTRGSRYKAPVVIEAAPGPNREVSPGPPGLRPGKQTQPPRTVIAGDGSRVTRRAG